MAMTTAPKLTTQQRTDLRQAARQEMACRELAHFVRFCWDEVESTPLVWGNHLDLICQELVWLSEGRARCLECWHIETEDRLAGRWGGEPDPDCERCGGVGMVDVTELVVVEPPGHAKSIIASVMFPAWLWLRDPSLNLLTLANIDSLAIRDTKKMRDLILSDSYQHLQKRQAIRTGKAAPAKVRGSDVLINRETEAEWEPWGLSKDQAEKVNFENTAKGGREARGINAVVTGKRCGGLIVDDPHDEKHVRKGKPARVIERLRETRSNYFALESRLNVGAWKLVIMQRLHAADLVGELIKEGDETTRVICLPVRYDPDHPQAHPGDNREIDEWLCEAAFAEAKEALMKRRLSPRHYRAQYEQQPSSDVGGMFRRSWFGQRYQSEPMIFCSKARFSNVEISVDCTFKATPGADFVVLQVWGLATRDPGARLGPMPGRYLLDEVRARMDIIDTCQALRDLSAKWPQVTRVLVEDKANGQAVIDIMKREGHSKIVAFDPSPHGSKEARANVATVYFEAGDVWLPLPEHAPWIGDYVEEMVAFPSGANDDRVDATSMVFLKWKEDGGMGGDVNAEFAWMADL